jgi:hypothetical protein
MPRYHFSLQNKGSRIDDFGGVDFEDDAEALTFGKRVIRELLDKNPEHHALWTMDVTVGKRAVRSLPLR